MLNLLNTEIFPDDILRALSKHLMNLKASTANDYELSILLRKYDDAEVITVSDVPDGSAFTIQNGREFIKSVSTTSQSQRKCKFRISKIFFHVRIFFHVWSFLRISLHGRKLYLPCTDIRGIPVKNTPLKRIPPLIRYENF